MFYGLTFKEKCSVVFAGILAVAHLATLFTVVV